jgi:nucleotide-binding universal stress UspA family protein
MPECYDFGRTAIDLDDMPGIGRISLIESDSGEETQVWRPAEPSRELFMYRKILVVAFGTELSDKAVKEAAQLAAGLGAKLLVLHVRSPLDIPHHAAGGALARSGGEKITEEIDEEERKFLDRAVAITTSIGIKAETAFIADLLPYEAIIRVCEEQQCDLIVMGTRIRHGIPGYLGKSTTQKVLEHTEIPVLVVR